MHPPSCVLAFASVIILSLSLLPVQLAAAYPEPIKHGQEDSKGSEPVFVNVNISMMAEHLSERSTSEGKVCRQCIPLPYLNLCHPTTACMVTADVGYFCTCQLGYKSSNQDAQWRFPGNDNRVRDHPGQKCDKKCSLKNGVTALCDEVPISQCSAGSQGNTTSGATTEAATNAAVESTGTSENIKNDAKITTVSQTVGRTTHKETTRKTITSRLPDAVTSSTVTHVVYKAPETTVQSEFTSPSTESAILSTPGNSTVINTETDTLPGLQPVETFTRRHTSLETSSITSSPTTNHVVYNIKTTQAATSQTKSPIPTESVSTTSTSTMSPTISETETSTETNTSSELQTDTLPGLQPIQTMTRRETTVESPSSTTNMVYNIPTLNISTAITSSQSPTMNSTEVSTETNTSSETEIATLPGLQPIQTMTRHQTSETLPSATSSPTTNYAYSIPNTVPGSPTTTGNATLTETNTSTETETDTLPGLQPIQTMTRHHTTETLSSSNTSSTPNNAYSIPNTVPGSPTTTGNATLTETNTSTETETDTLPGLQPIQTMTRHHTTETLSSSNTSSTPNNAYSIPNTVPGSPTTTGNAT
ncbi:hypothetical protein HDU76_010574, partial [Blyttiomyces sp. JEL0837]